ncbi:hypothetical protein diail_11046 [Diaporthe ilicicola]|nr:hypothetical protein diail_11046 [Diaporthe ilicicola]
MATFPFAGYSYYGDLVPYLTPATSRSLIPRSRTPPILPNNLAINSQDDYGREPVRWTWRCTSCARINYLDRRIESGKPWNDDERNAPYHRCDQCRDPAKWSHLASEFLVNRALRAPHEFLRTDPVATYAWLGYHDGDRFGRISHPPHHIQRLAEGWTASRRDLMVRTDERPSPSLSLDGGFTFQHIRDYAPSEAGGGIYWDKIRVLD